MRHKIIIIIIIIIIINKHSVSQKMKDLAEGELWPIMEGLI